VGDGSEPGAVRKGSGDWVGVTFSTGGGEEVQATRIIAYIRNLKAKTGFITRVWWWDERLVFLREWARYTRKEFGWECELEE
jgi:hypothetical protein